MARRRLHVKATADASRASMFLRIGVVAKSNRPPIVARMPGFLWVSTAPSCFRHRKIVSLARADSASAYRVARHGTRLTQSPQPRRGRAQA